MPTYIYEHPETGERKEIVQFMSEAHSYEELGVAWNRVYEAPQAAMGETIGKIDPFDKQSFIEKTGKLRNIKQGDLWDISKDLSEKRAKKAGKDPVKERTIKDYERKCGGRKHPLDQ